MAGKETDEQIYERYLDSSGDLDVDELNTVLRWRDENPRDAKRVENRRERERQDAVDKETLLDAWLQEGGTAEDFDKAWPSFRAERQVKNLRDLQERVSDEALRRDSERQTLREF